MQTLHANLDLTDLQDEVMEKWEQDNELCFKWVAVSGEYDGGHTELRDEYEAILQDPIAMIVELGFNKISDYCRERNATCQN